MKWQKSILEQKKYAQYNCINENGIIQNHKKRKSQKEMVDDEKEKTNGFLKRQFEEPDLEKQAVLSADPACRDLCADLLLRADVRPADRV